MTTTPNEELRERPLCGWSNGCASDAIGEYAWRFHEKGQGGVLGGKFVPLCDMHAHVVAGWLTVFCDDNDFGLTVSQRRLPGGRP